MYVLTIQDEFLEQSTFSFYKVLWIMHWIHLVRNPMNRWFPFFSDCKFVFFPYIPIVLKKTSSVDCVHFG